MDETSGSPILVTGGTGNLGRRVVRRLGDAGEDVRTLSRRGGPDSARVAHLVGDTVHGSGLAAAARGVGRILHLAGGAKGDDVAAANVSRAAKEAGVRHLVLISVIGADAMPIGYFRAKAAAEKVIAASGVPYSILRAAQVHDFVLRAVGAMARLPVIPIPRGMRVEPVEAEELAEALVHLLSADPAGRAPDLAGPEVLDLEQVVRPLLELRGSRRVLWHAPILGAAGRGYRAGDNLANAAARRGGRTWEQYLAALASRAG